ncbi:MAG: hypothetical protein AB2A00_02875 [Myxococcota bacterium]
MLPVLALILAVHAQAEAEGAGGPSRAATEAAPSSATTPSEERPAPTLAVLPVRMITAGAAGAEGSIMLTSALTARMQEASGYRVLSTDEVQEMLSHEAVRQAAGCAEDSCLTELLGAIHSELVVLSEVRPVGGVLLFTSSLIRQSDASVVERASTQGRTLQSLVAQTEEMALALAGKPESAVLEGPVAMQRLGFTTPEDLAAFRTFREEHPQATTTEALTEFIVQHNVESRALVAGEAVAFGLSAVGALALVMVFLPVYGAVVSSTVNPPLLMAVAVPLAITGPLVVLSAMVGVALAVVDALNLGRVAVRRSGCCRRDADIHDANGTDGFHKALALFIALSGPFTAAMLFQGLGIYGAMVAVVMLTGLGISYDEIESTTDAYQATFEGNLALAVGAPPYYLGFLAALTPLLVATPVGLLLLLWPSPSPVEDDPAPAATTKTGSAP